MEGHASIQKSRKGRTKRFLTTSLMRKSLAYRAMLKRGWSEVSEADDWDFYWYMSSRIVAPPFG